MAVLALGTMQGHTRPVGATESIADGSRAGACLHAR